MTGGLAPPDGGQDQSPSQAAPGETNPPQSPTPNSAAAQRSTDSGGGQQIAAFIVGCFVLALLFIATVLGWFGEQYKPLIVQLCVAVAGAGFASFLLGYINLNWGWVTAGGPIAIFLLLLYLNPARNIVPANPAFDECKTEVLGEKYSAAVPVCTEASRALPNDPGPPLWLGKAQYHLGKYQAAIESWKNAERLGGDAGVLNYNVGFAYVQQGDRNEAIKAWSVSADKAPNDAVRAMSWYQIADTERANWNFGEGTDDQFVNAVGKYKAYLETDCPKYKAAAELSCMLAKKAELTSDEKQRKSYEDRALSQFKAALDEMRKYNGPDDKQEEIRAFISTYGSNGDDPCGRVLAALWNSKGQTDTYDAALADLRK